MPGRPRLKNNERPFSVNVYLTSKEWVFINNRSKEDGKSKSAAIREIIGSYAEVLGKTL